MAWLGTIVIILAVATASPAYAYIDPGTASIALQAVIGAIAVASLYFRSTIAKMFRFLRPGSSVNQDNAPPRPAEPAEKSTDDN